MSSNGLTSGVLKLWVKALDNKGITFKNQSIYKSHQRYYDAIGLLKANNMIRPICSICFDTLEEDDFSVCKRRNKEHREADHSIRMYGLTWTGWFTARILKRFYPKPYPLDSLD